MYVYARGYNSTYLLSLHCTSSYIYHDSMYWKHLTVLYLIFCRPVHDNGRSYREGRDRKYRHDHPIRTGKFRVHPEYVAVFIRDVLEDLEHSFRRQNDFFLL